jgi:tetratricopeptide (TPR) repeat protein
VAAALEANDRYRALLRGTNPWDSRGGLLFIAGRSQEAVAAFQKSIELDPAARNHISVLQLAFVYADQKSFSSAESTLKEYGRLSNDPRMLFFEAQMEETRGQPEAARELYRKAVTELASTNRDELAGQALQESAYLSQMLGESASELAFARQQKLNGQEHAAISFLEAVGGDSAGSDRSLQQYASACPWWTPPGLQMFRARNQLAVALQRNDVNAARQFISRIPMFPLVWIPFYEARAALLRKDYASAEHLLGRTLLLHRYLNSYSALNHTRSPLVSQLCHFYLGQVCEVAGRRDQAVGEYREFLSWFDGTPAHLPQIAEGHAALKRLGAQ